MRWGDSTQKTRQKRLSDNEYFSKIKIWNYEINLQKYRCSSTAFSLKSSVVEHRMKSIIWINATRKCTQSADELERNAAHQTAGVMKRKHIFHHRNGRIRNDTDVSWNLAKCCCGKSVLSLARYCNHKQPVSKCSITSK